MNLVSRMRCPAQALFNSLVLNRAALLSLKFCLSSTTSCSSFFTEDGLSLSGQERVLNMLTQYKDSPSYTKGKKLSVDKVTSWVNGGGGSINSSTYNFLLHVCVQCGSAEDLDMAVALGERNKLSLSESAMNSVLTSLSKSADFPRVKDTLSSMIKAGWKVRVNTLTSVLQRCVNERDIPFACEIVEMMKRNNFFPTDSNVIHNALQVCVGAEGSEAVELVRGVMTLHNTCTVTTPQRPVELEIAAEFTNWINSLPGEHQVRRTRVNERCVCENCGEELISNQLSRGDRETLIHYIQEQMSHDISTGRSAVKEQRIMNAFTEYINKHSERFGTVVDGLNVAYYCIRRREKAFETLLAICRKLVDTTGKEVLMIGREHLLKKLGADKMSSEVIHEQYKMNGIVFTPLKNSTPDDRYTLLAALVTNSRVVLSNDKFGFELDRLKDDKIAMLMKKWLNGVHAKVNIGTKTIKLLFPTRVQREVQWTENSWHLPLDTPSPSRWLCVQAASHGSIYETNSEHTLPLP